MKVNLDGELKIELSGDIQIPDEIGKDPDKILQFIENNLNLIIDTHLSKSLPNLIKNKQLLIGIDLVKN